MYQALEALVPGIALGGVLAAGAAWARRSRAGLIPHLGLGATAAVAAAAAARAGALPAALRLLVAVAAGAAFAAVAEAVDRRVSSAQPPWALPPLTADAAVLGLALAATRLLAAPGPAGVAAGPLGGAADGALALVAGAVGLAAALLLAAPDLAGLPRRARWALTGAGLAAAAALAAGLPGAAALGGGLPQGVTDPAGLALRTGAAALAGRDPVDAAGAGVALGLVEALLRAARPLGQLGLLPAAAAAVVGLLVGLRRGAPLAVGGG